MRLHEIEALALPLIPGSGVLSLQRVGAGLYNDTYRAVRDGRQFSLRIAGRAAPSHAAVAAAAWEAEVRRGAARAGLAAALLHSDARRGILLCEWFEGRAWPAAKAAGLQVLPQVADLLRRVHSLPIPAPARMMEAGAWIERYSAALELHGAGGFAALRPAAARRLQQLRTLPQAAGVICHSDVHRHNLLERQPAAPGEAGLTLLDWEYCHVSEPLWDLASWSANNDFDAAAQRSLLQAYRRGAADDAQLLRISLLTWLYDYVCLLWGELYACVRPEHAAGGAARTAVLAERLSANVM